MLHDSNWFKNQKVTRGAESSGVPESLPPRIADVPRIFEVVRVLWVIDPKRMASLVGEQTATKARLLIIVIADAVDHKNGWTFIRESTIGSRLGLCGDDSSKARCVRRTLKKLVEAGIVVEWKRGRRVYRRVELSGLQGLAGASVKPASPDPQPGLASSESLDSRDRETGLGSPPITSLSHNQNITTPITDPYREVGRRLADLGVKAIDRVIDGLQKANADLGEVNGAIDHFKRVGEQAGYEPGALVWRLKPENLGQSPSVGFPKVSQAARNAIREQERLSVEETLERREREFGHLIKPGTETLAALIVRLNRVNPSLALIARDSTMYGREISCVHTRRALLKIADEPQHEAA